MNNIFPENSQSTGGHSSRFSILLSTHASDYSAGLESFLKMHSGVLQYFFYIFKNF
jgi:hypothetical protein